jgi:hypothetical protein
MPPACDAIQLGWLRHARHKVMDPAAPGPEARSLLNEWDKR